MMHTRNAPIRTLPAAKHRRTFVSSLINIYIKAYNRRTGRQCERPGNTGSLFFIRVALFLEVFEQVLVVGVQVGIAFVPVDKFTLRGFGDYAQIIIHILFELS